MDTRKKHSSDKHLITEQPGMSVVVTGLLIAFLIGYTTKVLLSPARVTAHIEKAASHIHKDIKVQFSSAYLSLSDGILPRFAVVISDVQMIADQSCWGAPTMEIDELRLPLSFFNLIQGKVPVESVEANTVDLTFREGLSDCVEQDQKKAEKETKEPAPLVSLSPTEKAQKYQNDVRSISIQKFLINADKYPQYASEFLNFAVKVKSFEPRIIEITAKTHLLKDQVGDYMSHANLYVQYKDTPEEVVQTHFFGNWREGHYSFIANYTIDERLLSVETDLKHIPLSQILGVLQKYDLASKELNGRQVWVSSKARMVAPLEDLRKAPLEVRDLRLEGDLGEMSAEQIEFSSLDPVKYSPISVDIKTMDINKLLVLLNRPKATSMLGSLGTFTGRATIFSDQKINLKGKSSGLEFVFSNKGQRESQVIETMISDISLEGNTWNFQVQRIEPRDGVFIGDVKVKADRDFKEVEIKTSIDELSLSPSVQSLMTGGGQIGTLSFDSDLKLKAGQVSFLKGLLRLDSLDIEGMSLEKTKATIDWVQGEIILNTQVKSVEVSHESVATSVLKQVTEAGWWQQEGLKLESLNGQFKVKNLKHLGWKNFHGSVGKSGKMITDGGWDEFGRLDGMVQIRDGKLNRRWSIEGSRELPAFVEERSPAMRK